MESYENIKDICNALFASEFILIWTPIDKLWESKKNNGISNIEKDLLDAALNVLNEVKIDLNSTSLIMSGGLQYFNIVSYPLHFSDEEYTLVGIVNRTNANNWPVELSCNICLAKDIEALCNSMGFGRLKKSVSPKEIPMLTKRESQVLELIVEGHTQKRMADLLDISNSTIETYKQRIFKKFKVRSSIELVIEYNMIAK